MEFIKPGTHIDFVGARKYAYIASGVLILMTIILLLTKGPNYGVDFAGGNLIEVKFKQATDAQTIRQAIEGLNLGETSIQDYGEGGANEFLIRIPQKQEEVVAQKKVEAKEEKKQKDLGQLVQTTLEEKFGKGALEIRRVEMVGPKVGKDLREKALFALFYAILFIGIYISGRFEMKWLMSIVVAASLSLAAYLASTVHVGATGLVIVALLVTVVVCFVLKLKYALGAIVALIHDVTITMGIFTLLDKEFSLTIVAALLTIIGYSLNDTIVVFDRIRENLRKGGKVSFGQIINNSINETLSRTIMTGGATLLVLLCLYFLGGPVNSDFALTLLVGIVVGTYSSIYVASPILLIWPPEGGRTDFKTAAGFKPKAKPKAAVA